MTPTRKRRLIAVLAVVAGVGLATALAVTAFRNNMLYFVSPSEVSAGEVQTDTPIRVGGLVVEGSVKRDPDSLWVQFDLTDYASIVSVQYEGILPDLFREGQGIVALGSLDGNGVLVASQVLAKHDENYMPPEVADALEKGKQKDGA
ncbi:MAG: cytochrome c maturation protein CcmE [Xanthomonadales bacterium]|nr:cytochrome c maturation protein CcmE [Xanthomonadales bacterium]